MQISKFISKIFILILAINSLRAAEPKVYNPEPLKMLTARYIRNIKDEAQKQKIIDGTPDYLKSLLQEEPKLKEKTEAEIEFAKENYISALAFHPSSDFIACGFDSGPIKIFRVKDIFQNNATESSPFCKLAFNSCENPSQDNRKEYVEKLVYTPGGDFLISHHGYNNIKIWGSEKIIDFKDLNVFETLTYPDGHIELEAFAFALKPIRSEDGNFVLAVKERHTISFWELNLYSETPSVSKIGEISAPEYCNSKNGLVFSACGNLLAMARSNFINIWRLDFNNLKNSQIILRIAKTSYKGGLFWDVEFSNDGNYLISTNVEDQDLKLTTWKLNLSLFAYDKAKQCFNIEGFKVFPNSNKVAKLRRQCFNGPFSLKISNFNFDNPIVLEENIYESSNSNKITISPDEQYLALTKTKYVETIYNQPNKAIYSLKIYDLSKLKKS